MNKGLFLTLLFAVIGMVILAGKKGMVHYCSKGSECNGLIPKAKGCLARRNQETQCFFVKDSNVRERKYSYHFDN